MEIYAVSESNRGRKLLGLIFIKSMESINTSSMAAGFILG
jgi:hypothetical protein